MNYTQTKPNFKILEGKTYLDDNLLEITIDLTQLDVDFRNEKIQSDIDEELYHMSSS